MKKYICILIILLGFSKVNSQYTYEYLYSSSYDEITRSLYEDDIGNIYFPVENFEFGLIVKLDTEGNFFDSIQLLNPYGTCNIGILVPKDTNHFIAIGSWTVDSTSQLWYLELSNDLQVLNDKKIDSYGLLIFNFHYINNNVGNIVFIASYQPTNSSTDLNICMYEISVNGNLIRSNFFNQGSSFNIGSTILEDVLSNSYKLFSLIPVSNRSSCTINYIDSLLFALDSNFIITPTVMRDQNSAKWINDSTYLLTGRVYSNTQEEWDIGILKMNSRDSIISSANYGKIDTNDFAGLYHNIDFISSNNIFYAGESNIYGIYQNDPSWIMLNIIDSDLNLISQHYFGGDAFYLVNAILATQDSGCVMACSRYDWLTQDNEFDVYILKVNKDGLLVSIPENNINQENSCIVYPNPASTRLTIHFEEGKSTNYSNRIIEFLNASGIKVKVVKIPSISKVSISVQDLEIGVYLLNIIDNGRVISSKKLMIAR